jgi:RHS repeat-associated protein
LLTQRANVYTCDSAANRLTSVTSGTLTTAFEYDGLGNRVGQTVDGLETRYTLDTSAGLSAGVAGGLPEVIVATTGGASTYYVQIQGQILGQEESGRWAYVLPDHLPAPVAQAQVGSVRQLVDSEGQVALAQSYDPFGVPFEASGSGASDFGYTGEWWGSYNDLLFLRARYYDPAVGRFLSKDLWAGDPNQPQTLGCYAYAVNNTPNHTDRSGYIPTREEAGTKYMYSCNCGWIDWSHAGSALGQNILERVEAAQSGNAPLWDFARITNLHTPETRSIVGAGVMGNVEVSRNLYTSQQQWEVSLGILVSLQNAFEVWQGGPSGVSLGLPRRIASRLNDQSSFSEEDLLSDLIGFHRALLTHKSNKAEDERATKLHFITACRVIDGELLNRSNLDKPPSEFIKTQQDIYDEYMSLGGFVPVRHWGRPCLGRLSGSRCPDNPQIPPELVSLNPEPPGKKWHWSIANFFLQVDNRRFNLGDYTPQINEQNLRWRPY